MARGPSVLIVDDDPAVRRLIRRGLAEAGYRVQETEPGRGALERIAKRQFELLILDIDPPADGLEAVRAVRALSPIPIVALSIRTDEDAAVDALENGADDYIQKPFGIRELLARVNNALRRKAREQGKLTRIETGDLEIDLLYRRVRSRGNEIHLAVKPYEILRILAEASGKVVTHQELVQTVWNSHCANSINYLRVAIGELRRRIEADPADPQYIVTEPRVGYRLAIRERFTRRESPDDGQSAGPPL